MKQMLDRFEKKKEQEPRARLANLILMEISNKSQDASQGNNFKANAGGQSSRQEEESSYIIGGYASDAWLPKSDEQSPGDSTCFLFNLTLDLRFRALENKDFY